MAVSGIDHTIKIFSPDALEQQNARRGIGVHKADPGLSSLHLRHRRRAQAADASSSTADPLISDDEEHDQVALNGLSSRKRMHQEYEIISKNDMDRKGGREDAFITVSPSQVSSMSLAWPVWSVWSVWGEWLFWLFWLWLLIEYVS